MKIANITIEENNIVITLDAATEVTKVYIDTLDNDANKYSATDSEHIWTIADFTMEGSKITIDYTVLDPELDKSAFTVLINNVLGFYYDEKELYNKEICLLTEFCSTCLDKAEKEREVLFVIKYELMKYAKDNELIEDQISTYRDLARMLNIDTKLNARIPNNCRCNNRKGCKCCNGCCSIC